MFGNKDTDISEDCTPQSQNKSGKMTNDRHMLTGVWEFGDGRRSGYDWSTAPNDFNEANSRSEHGN